MKKQQLSDVPMANSGVAMVSGGESGGCLTIATICCVKVLLIVTTISCCYEVARSSNATRLEAGYGLLERKCARFLLTVDEPN